MSVEVLPGEAFPLGATPRHDGTNFAVTSGADGVLLCLFDADGAETQVPLQERDGDVRFGPEIYGYTVDDPGTASTLDSAAHVPRSLVVDSCFVKAW
jgi:glycogen operon protein